MNKSTNNSARNSIRLVLVIYFVSWRHYYFYYIKGEEISWSCCMHRTSPIQISNLHIWSFKIWSFEFHYSKLQIWNFIFCNWVPIEIILWICLFIILVPTILYFVSIWYISCINFLRNTPLELYIFKTTHLVMKFSKLQFFPNFSI